MKTLRQSLGVEKYVSELNGYLSAVSHFNDTFGYRHGFFADLIYLDEKPIFETIREYLEKDSLDLQEIGLKEERIIIEKFIYNNFLLGEKVDVSKNISFIKEQLIWHIQEYIGLAAIDKKEEKRWAYYSKEKDNETSIVFVKIEEHLVVMWFHFRKEDVNT